MKISEVQGIQMTYGVIAMERLGELMKQRRENFGLTQEDLARRMNVPTRQVTRWENAETKPPIDKLALWLKLLGVAYSEVEAILLEHQLDFAR